MKYIKLFEAFTKDYMKKIDLKDFKKIKKGAKIKYMGGSAVVIDNNGYVLTLKGEDGKTVTVNKSQFDHGGMISEISVTNEGKIELALNKIEKWMPEDQDVQQEYYDIIDKGNVKDMEEFLDIHADEEVLKSFGIKYRDLGKLAKAAIDESVVNEAEKYITDEFKVGDKIKTGFGEWEVIETDYAPNKSFMGSFIFKGKDMKRVNIPNPPRTNKNAVGYKVTDGDKYPIIGFLYQYKDITKLATVGVDESIVNEGSDQDRLTYFRKLSIAPNNQPQNGAYIKSVSKPGKFFVDWKDAFDLGDVALEFVKSVGSISEFDIIDLKTMKRTGKQLDVKKGQLGNLRTTYGVRVNESSAKDGGDKSNGNSHHDDHTDNSIAQHWKDTYGEEFHSKYPAVAKIVKQRNIKDKRELKRIWDETYGENFEEQYPALYNKLD